MSHVLSETFQTFAEAECKGSSALYDTLSRSIAQDEAVLDIAAHVPPGQPIPNLLFAAVHYLLLSGEFDSHPLTTFYLSCGPSPAKSAEAYPYFRDFVLGHSSEIISLLKSRRVQTNEVRRCAFLLPAFLFALSHFQPMPLALVEIGTSAGLNLLWDKYSYSYGTSEFYGDLASPILLASSFRGVRPSMLANPLPEISRRIGLDVSLVDTNLPDQAAWLRALVWPEHEERRRLMNAALQMRNAVDLDLRQGNGFAMLFDLVQEISEEALLCVYHTHVANQITPEARQAFLESMAELGKKRDVIHIFNNIKPNLHLTAYCQGRFIDMPLANTDPHARWIEWLAYT